MFVALRDCVNELIALQMDEYSAESRIQEAQAELNRLYDAFSAKHGLINDRANRLAFSDDSSYYLLCSLEVLDDDGKLERKADMFHKRTIKQQRSVDSVDTASEALAVCIGEKACVDLDFMATLMGSSEKIPQIVEDLKGVIYKEPNSADLDLSAQIARRFKGFVHELLDVLLVKPCRTQPHLNLAGFKVFRLCGSQRFHIHGVGGIKQSSIFRLSQFFSDIAG